jgi:hypothetical protein
MAATGHYREILVVAPPERGILVDAHDGISGKLRGIYGGVELEEAPPRTAEKFTSSRADSEFRRLVPESGRFKGVAGSVVGARACAGDMTNVRIIIASARMFDGGSSVEHIAVVDVDAVGKNGRLLRSGLLRQRFSGLLPGQLRKSLRIETRGG